LTAFSPNWSLMPGFGLRRSVSIPSWLIFI
jgi:hypothetical protein